MTWDEFAATAPELAAIGERRFERTGLALVGTLRKDGWPRISPVEPYIVDGDLMLGMMWRSRKALDLLRDPRVVVHSTTCDREGPDGDFKLYGRAREVTDAAAGQRFGDAVKARINWHPPEPYHLFSVSVESAAFVIFGKESFGLRWSPRRGVHRWTFPAG